MHVFLLVLFSLIALFWTAYALRIVAGAAQLPYLKSVVPAENPQCPRISLLFAARDEAEKLPDALATMLAMDYPNLEIVAVNDRSKDETAEILRKFAERDPRLRVVTIAELPKGWLGKPHALQKAFEASAGEWLVFTDADVKFQQNALRRAVSLVADKKLEHLTLMGDVEMSTFWEKVLLTFFGFGFSLGANPGSAGKAKSKSYVGVGAFQMVKREAYVKCGMHKRLAMEVVDDMKLAKILKESGARSGVAIAEELVSVQWHAGAGNIIRGVTKNFFAAAQFRIGLVAAQLIGSFLVNVLPFVALPFLRGWLLVPGVISVTVPVILHGAVARVMKASPLYGLTHPIGATLFSYMLLRSMVVTLRQGGVVWRDTFYPLEELRRGLI